ncbi:MAG: light-harvesting antenna LH1, alpha subunit [Thiohalocapsa sp.]
MNDKMHKIWTLIQPSTALIGLAVFLTVLGLGIHMILLSTTEFNWLEDGIPTVVASPSAQVAPQQM